MIQIQLDDQAVRAALTRVGQNGADLRPMLGDVGELLTETTKQRFETSKAPDGSSWAPNQPSTLDAYLGQFKGSFGKTGRLTKKGAQRAAAKKPLIGETRSLSTTIHYVLGANSVEIGSSLVYAAVQQLGAAARSFSGGKSPWGDIPARPFLGLSDQDQAGVLQIAGDHLLEGVR